MDRSRTLPQIKVLVCGKSLAPDSARLSLDRRLPTVSLRIEGDWRADHAGDVVDTEPKMAKAVLVAGGGFIPDEDRILGPADRPGRPPFLRPVGANQSRDDGDVAHSAHRHLARLHDVPVLITCHMTSIEQVCQPCRPRRARWAGSAVGPKCWKVHRMQLGSVRRCSLILSVQSHIHDVVSSAASSAPGVKSK